MISKELLRKTGKRRCKAVFPVKKVLGQIGRAGGLEGYPVYRKGQGKGPGPGWQGIPVYRKGREKVLGQVDRGGRSGRVSQFIEKAGNRSVKALYQGGSGEIVEKKSRFIATFEAIGSEEDALAFIGKIKKQYWDARHNCYAFVAGEGHSLRRYSDDGEPAGTAGRPMLDVLLKEDIHNAVVVVTRYFGGTLLGTGGLVRAYQKAVQEGLKNSVVIDKIQGRSLKIACGYDSIGKVQYILAKNQVAAIGASYTDRVVTEAMVPEAQLEKLKQEITEGTNGAASFETGDLAEFADIGGKIKIF